MNFAERLEFLLKSKNIKQADLADSCDFRRQTISDWKRTGTLPSSEIAIKIAKRLDVSIDYLLTGNEKDGSGVVLSDSEEELLKNFRELTPDIQAMINIQISALAARK